MILAFETSCDETSAAVVSGGRVLSNLVSSQARLHAEYGGVVPELATREHLRQLAPLSRAALGQAGVEPAQLEAVAATLGPGLPSALLVGVRAAQGLAFALGRPFLGIHHHAAHLYSPWMAGDPPIADFAALKPNVSLVVSGGHTLLVQVAAPLEHRLLGGTLDDAAGECFDKVAKLIGLPYPGGPEMERLAEEGDARRFVFPRPMLREAHDDFSFSGLKTAVRYFLRDRSWVLEDGQAIRDLCASVQAAIVEILVVKTLRAAVRLGVWGVTASGGVSRNHLLRRELASACRERGLGLRVAEPSLCTDNAAMIGALAELELRRQGRETSLDAEIRPGWELGEAEL